MRIFDLRNREVWGAMAGAAGLEWNGRSARGAILPSGRYLIVAEKAGARASVSAAVDLVRR